MIEGGQVSTWKIHSCTGVAPGLHRVCTSTLYWYYNIYVTLQQFYASKWCEIRIRLVVSVAALKRNQQRRERLIRRRLLVRAATNQRSRDLVQIM